MIENNILFLKILGIKNLYSSSKNVVIVHHLDQALRSQGLFHREEEYVVHDGEIVIVDQNTGHLMIGRRYSEGLHQAIEAKEGLGVQAESRTSATITFITRFTVGAALGTVDGFCEYAGTGGFPYPPRTAEKKCHCQLIIGNGIF